MATKKRYLFPTDYMADPSVHIFNGKISHGQDASYGTAMCRNMRQRSLQMRRNKQKAWVSVRRSRDMSCISLSKTATMCSIGA